MQAHRKEVSPCWDNHCAACRGVRPRLLIMCNTNCWLLCVYICKWRSFLNSNAMNWLKSVFIGAFGVCSCLFVITDLMGIMELVCFVYNFFWEIYMVWWCLDQEKSCTALARISVCFHEVNGYVFLTILTNLLVINQFILNKSIYLICIINIIDFR